MGDEKETIGGSPLVEGRVITNEEIERAGYAMPLADPAVLRAAQEQRQRLLTSLLDPDRDFLYSVRYTDRQGDQRTVYEQTMAGVQKQVKHLGEGTTWSAHPKKSGVLKLAHALGIESRMVSVEGLPKDPKATYSSCRYIARHKRTGREEEGQGYCDADERKGRKAHAIISMADTRAYIHAVLRCAGYDNVGAESMTDTGDDEVSVQIQNVIPAAAPAAPALPASTTPTTMTSELAATPAAEPLPVATPAAAPPAAASTASAPVPGEPLPPTPPPEGLGKGDLITQAMAGELSLLMVAKLGSKEKARTWLKGVAGVERSIHVREEQFSELKTKLEGMEG